MTRSLGEILYIKVMTDLPSTRCAVLGCVPAHGHRIYPVNLVVCGGSSIGRHVTVQRVYT